MNENDKNSRVKELERGITTKATLVVANEKELVWDQTKMSSNRVKIAGK